MEFQAGCGGKARAAKSRAQRGVPPKDDGIDDMILDGFMPALYPHTL